MPRVSARNALLSAAVHDPSPSLSLQDSSAVLAAKRTLRTNWKWAYVSHFIFMFEPMLVLADVVSVSNLEDDLAAGTTAYTPRVLVRLLTTLTHDRKITADNYQSSIYKQYIRRAPEALPALVTQSFVEKPKRETRSPSSAAIESELPNEQEDKMEEDDELEVTEHIEWVTLSLEQRIDILYDLCEWQFMNPTRLRANMKYDDEWATWRIEPIGYDASLNAYYVLGGDRLWIQHVLPKKFRKDAKKSKSKSRTQARPKPKDKNKASKPTESTKPSAPTRASRKRSAPVEIQEESLPSKRTKRSSATNTLLTSNSRTGRPSRAAAKDANKRLAALPQTTMNPRSTRASTRLRGLDHEDLWQEIPEAWLRADEANGHAEESDQGDTAVSEDRNDDDDDDVFGGAESELTELSDPAESEDDNETLEEPEVEGLASGDEESEGPDPPPPKDFIEWETLVITLAEWEAFPARFETSTNRHEKAFHKLLTAPGGLVHGVIETLRESLFKRQQEDAVVHRKRSSRLAIKESEKEEARLLAQKKAEEDEKLERTRRWEARLHKEDEARRKREETREARRRALEDKRQESIPVDIIDDDAQPAKGPSANNGAKSGPSTPIRRANGALSGVSTPTGTEDWELNCELCGVKGININDGTEITCCESCGKWQHVWCHDQNDIRMGRPRRNWEHTEFRCWDCSRTSRAGPSQKPKPKPKPTNTNGAHPSLPSLPNAIPQYPHFQQNYNYRWPTYPHPSLNQTTSQQPILNPAHTTPNTALVATGSSTPKQLLRPYYSPQVPQPTAGVTPRPITFAPNMSAENYQGGTKGTVYQPPVPLNGSSTSLPISKSAQAQTDTLQPLHKPRPILPNPAPLGQQLPPMTQPMSYGQPHLPLGRAIQPYPPPSTQQGMANGRPGYYPAIHTNGYNGRPNPQSLNLASQPSPSVPRSSAT